MLKLSSCTEKIKNAEILVLGCSAGGFNVIFELLTNLALNFHLPVVVVIHRSRKFKSGLEDLITQKGNLKAKCAEHGEVMEKGKIYFAPADYHLLIEPEGEFALDFSEPIFYCRPSIDITFESISDVYKDKVIAILFSGANEDGANGLYYIEKQGGLTIVQDPEDAEVKTMPLAALSISNTHIILKDKDIYELMKSITALYNLDEKS